MKTSTLIPVVAYLGLAGYTAAAPVNVESTNALDKRTFCFFGIGWGCNTATTSTVAKPAATSAAASSSVKAAVTSSSAVKSSAAASSSAKVVSSAVASSSAKAVVSTSAAATKVSTASWAQCTDFDWNSWGSDWTWGGGFDKDYVKAWYVAEYGFAPPQGMNWKQVSSLVSKFGQKTKPATPKTTSKYTGKGCSNPWTSVVNTKTAVATSKPVVTSAAASKPAVTSAAVSSAVVSKASSSAAAASSVAVSKPASSAAASSAAASSASASVAKPVASSSSSAVVVAPASSAAASSAASSAAASSAAASSAAASSAAASSAAASSAAASPAASSAAVASPSPSADATSASSAAASPSAGTGSGSGSSDGSAGSPGTGSGSSDGSTGVPGTGGGVPGTGAGSNTATGTSTSDAPVATTPAATVVNGFTYGGCVQEVAGRLLDKVQTSNSAMTIEMCTGICDSYGYAVAGVEYGSECYCGTLEDIEDTDVSGECKMPCSGDNSQICGGPNALNIYVDASNVPATVVLPAGWTTYGTVTEGQNGRLLPVQLYNDNTNTVETCANRCAAAGYLIAGTEYSSECYCGNAFVSAANGGELVDDSAAFMKCAGDLAQSCGGPSILSVTSAFGKNIPFA